MKKSVLAIFLVLTICFSFAITAFAGEVSVFYKGVPINLSCNPVVHNGTTMVPFRSIFEALGLSVSWDASTQKVTGKNGKVEISFIIGQSKAYVNGVEKALTVAPFIYNDYTLVPVRFIAEATGYIVKWDEKNNRVIIGDTAVKGDISLQSSNATANIYSLYKVAGTGDYAGYYRLLGFPRDNEFSIYYKGTANSYQTATEDLRGLDLNEWIYWNFEGDTYATKRKDLYSFFSDTSYFSSHFGIEGRVLSQTWFNDTFGEVYLQWADTIGFSNDALKLVGKFLNKEAGIVEFDRFAAARATVDFIKENPQSDIMGKWISEGELRNKGVLFGYGAGYDNKSLKVGFYKGGASISGTVGPLIYATPSFNELAIRQSKNPMEVNGITMKNDEDDNLCFEVEDLKALKILGGQNSESDDSQAENTELAEFLSEWIAEDILSNEYYLRASWLGSYILISKNNTNYRIEGSPVSKFEPNKIYKGTYNGKTIRFQYIESMTLGGETEYINSICYNYSDLVSAGIITE